MSQTQFELSQFGLRGSELLKRGREVLEGATDEKIRTLAERVPAKIVEPVEAPRVVFTGQYSAGKSSLLRVITGREDIRIGAGITTDEVAEYHWNGIEVVDTPGIHTQLRPDHDDIAYKAIASAHLLVFVITNELMDSHMAGHF